MFLFFNLVSIGKDTFPIGSVFFFFKCYVMKCYGYLFGVIRVLEDTHRDECFIEANGHIIARNGIQLCQYSELVDIARSLNVDPFRLTVIDYDNI